MHGSFDLSTIGEIEQIQSHLCLEMESRNYPEADIFSVRLALDETLTNAIRHGNGHDPQKRVTVDCRVDDGQVWIQVEDEGDGFSLADVPDPTHPDHVDRPGGRGVFVIQRFMCSVEYNDRGNCVTMLKRNSSLG